MRDLVHAADPEVEETIKRTVQPYFVLQGNICALLAAKDHVNVFLYDGGIVPDPEGIITAGHDNKTARTVAFQRGRADQRAGADRDVPADHRQQPRRRLAQAEGGLMDHREVTRREFTRQVGEFERPDSFFGDREVLEWIGAHVPVSAEDVVLDVAGGAGHVGRHSPRAPRSGSSST